MSKRLLLPSCPVEKEKIQSNLTQHNCFIHLQLSKPEIYHCDLHHRDLRAATHLVESVVVDGDVIQLGAFLDVFEVRL